VTDRPYAIIVGAGIVGAACAAALSRDGFAVTVVDENFPATGTTAAGMGHLVVMDDSPAQLALTRYSVGRWREMAGELRIEHETSGTLWVAEDDAQLNGLRDKAAVYETAGVRAELLDARMTFEAEPHLRRSLVGALRVPDDAVVYPPAAALALLKRAERSGAQVIRSRVSKIEHHSVVLPDKRLNADVIVNAAGARAAELTPGVAIVPRKGHLAITDRGLRLCRHQIVETGYLTSAHVMTNESVAFNVQPRRTGQVLIGSSRELVGWNTSINRDILGRMLERAASYMPVLRDTPIIRTWIGFRPTTPDKLPLIGWHDESAGLMIAAGHEGLGITTATGTAELIAALASKRTTPIDAEPFDPRRTVEVHA
jgi:glycine/D-amino acid oxidase-like deaminating enzyme